MANENDKIDKDRLKRDRKRRSKVNILVVDDEVVQIETLSRGLKRQGYKVDHALNGKEALKKIHNKLTKVDMVLTDYAMPGMNGLSLLKNIRKSEQKLPVIMMTAYGDKEIIIDALRNRCDSFIEKPFTLEQLMEETERALSNVPEEKKNQDLVDMIPKHIHQINNPLMSIMGSAELAMLKMEDPEAVKESFKRIIGAAQKIHRINKEIMRSGRETDPQVEAVNLEILIQDCFKMFKDLLTLRNIEVDFDMGHRGIGVAGNKFGLEQLFKNLILNAIEAMEHSTQKQLMVETFYETSANTVVIKITDTGCGIPDKLLDTLFTPYVTSKEQGTGLGLSVVKSIVEKHGGIISVKSDPGEGTTFTIRLPGKQPDLN
jgi:signal transduction histidine kinase